MKRYHTHLHTRFSIPVNLLLFALNYEQKIKRKETRQNMQFIRPHCPTHPALQFIKTVDSLYCTSTVAVSFKYILHIEFN